jgi:glycine/D-amino acid oxidase-like deaminating enzyme
MGSSTQQVDALILGQGLAGTLLSFRMLQAGIDHVVVDRGHKRASSNVAAGIVNPVTGRRFVKAWKINELIQGLAIYEDLERLLHVKLINQITVYRDLSEVSALNQWDMRRNDETYSAYMGKPRTDLQLPVRAPERVGPTLEAAQVNLRELISNYRSFLREKGYLIEADINIDEVTQQGGRLRVGGFAARRIIDCTGAAAMSSNTWSKLPWRGTKGEAFRFSLKDMPRDLALKVKHFICPIGEGDEVWLGATNEDHFELDTPSSAGEERLREQATAFEIAVPRHVEHLAAVRPTVKDRRPLVGQHPTISRLWLCNGLGTKGTSLGPYCTANLLQAMQLKKTIDPEIDIANRFSV